MFSSLVQSCLTLCNPMNLCTPGLPVHHQLSGVYPNSCPLSRWCHLTISSSVVPFSSCLQCFPTSEFFPVSQFFASGDQNIGVSAWTPVSPSNEHVRLIFFRMDWLDLLAVQGTLKSLLQHHRSKASILLCSAFFIVQLSHPYKTSGKTIALIRWTFVGKVMSLLLNMLSNVVITFLPRSKRFLISWLQSTSAVIWSPQKIKSALFPHLFAMKWWDQMAWSSFSECWALSQLFHSPLSLSGKPKMRNNLKNN